MEIWEIDIHGIQSNLAQVRYKLSPYFNLPGLSLLVHSKHTWVVHILHLQQGPGVATISR